MNIDEKINEAIKISRNTINDCEKMNEYFKTLKYYRKKFEEEYDN